MREAPRVVSRGNARRPADLGRFHGLASRCLNTTERLGRPASAALARRGQSVLAIPATCMPNIVPARQNVRAAVPQAKRESATSAPWTDRTFETRLLQRRNPAASSLLMFGREPTGQYRRRVKILPFPARPADTRFPCNQTPYLLTRDMVPVPAYGQGSRRPGAVTSG